MKYSNQDIDEAIAASFKPKASHANVHATSMGFGGFRATVWAGEKPLASEHFPCKGWGKEASEAAYAEMKKWLASWGVG